MRLPRGRTRVLLALIVAIELLGIGIRSTFASLTSETANPGATVAAGTLTLATSAGSTTCDSWTGTSASNDVNADCGTLPLPAGPWFPGQQTSVAVSVTNAGSLSAEDLSLYMPTCAPGQDTNASYIPGFCDGVAFTVEEVTAAGAPVACFYPTATAGACSFSPTTYSSLSQVGEPGTLTDFSANYPDASQRLVLGALGAGATRHFELGFAVITATSPSLGNYYQGNTGTMSFVWHLDQQPLPGDATAP